VWEVCLYLNYSMKVRHTFDPQWGPLEGEHEFPMVGSRSDLRHHKRHLPRQYAWDTSNMIPTSVVFSM
jgi:hypothetical protein